MGLSDIGLIWTFTVLANFFFNLGIGILFIYKSKKTNARLLGYFGLYIIFAGLCWTGILIDIFSIVLTGTNVEIPNNFISVIGYFWMAPSGLMIMIISAEIVLPNKKWILIGSFTLLAVIYEILIFVDPINSFSVEYPQNPGESLIYDYIVLE